MGKQYNSREKRKKRKRRIKCQKQKKRSLIRGYAA